MYKDPLQAKESFFQEQDLSSPPSSHRDLGSHHAIITLALDSCIHTPTTSPHHAPSCKKLSFLGPTLKERQAEFEVMTKRQRGAARTRAQGLTRASTIPDVGERKNLPEGAWRRGGSRTKYASAESLKRTTSLPNLIPPEPEPTPTPFYIHSGVTPRELTHKCAKLATSIKLEPPHRQLLRGKLVYFHPPNDIALPRRRRIHKLIQLGAAWITQWRNDVEYVVFDDGEVAWEEVVRCFGKRVLPENVVVVAFEPYFPQRIEFGRLLDPRAPRFVVKGAQPCQPVSPTSTLVAKVDTVYEVIAD